MDAGVLFSTLIARNSHLIANNKVCRVQIKSVGTNRATLVTMQVMVCGLLLVTDKVLS